MRRIAAMSMCVPWEREEKGVEDKIEFFLSLSSEEANTRCFASGSTTVRHVVAGGDRSSSPYTRKVHRRIWCSANRTRVQSS